MLYYLQDSVNLVRDGKADIVAGVVGLLEKEAAALDAKILPGHFMTVPQAIAFPLNRTTEAGNVVRFLNQFVKRNLDFVAEKIEVVDMMLHIMSSYRHLLYNFLFRHINAKMFSWLLHLQWVP